MRSKLEKYKGLASIIEQSTVEAKKGIANLQAQNEKFNEKSNTVKAQMDQELTTQKALKEERMKVELELDQIEKDIDFKLANF